MSVLRFLDTEQLEIRNPLFLLSTENDTSSSDIHDIGFIGQYYNGSNLVYTGLFRDATDGIFKLFNNLQELPLVDSGSVNVLGTGYTRANLDLQDLHAYGGLTVDNDALISGSLTITDDFTVNGVVTTFNVSTLTVEDNIIIANAGPSNMKEDGGFVVRRTLANIVLDPAKESGTASAAGTTTTVTLQATNSHGTTLNYYVGWAIKFGGDITGSALVTESTAADPPVLTFDIAASTATTTASTYQLFNKQYVGTIYDESTEKLTFYGFPREDLIGSIDPAGDSGDGNLADYIDTRARDAYIDRDLYVQGVIKASLQADDNIMALNVGPTNSEDSGYVAKRTPARVVADTPLETGTASATGLTTTITLQAANGHGTTLNYYKNWVIQLAGDVTSIATVLSNTAADPPVLTFDIAATGTTSTSTTYKLFNQIYVGTIWDESSKVYRSIGFPREIGESVIDPSSPINGNIPTYIDIAVNNLTVEGIITYTSGSLIKTKTQVATVTFTASDILLNDIIYLNPSGDTTYTLPTTASLALITDRAINTIFINISTDKAIISKNSTDTIEGLSTLTLSRIYSKTVLTAGNAISDVWTIKG
jgi:hypothetical protein